MEEELELNEEQTDEVVEDMASTDDTISTTTMTDEIIPLVSTFDESTYTASDDATSYTGDDDTTLSDSDEKESSDDKWGSLDCRSECKYNTGSTYKYANYGYSD